MSVFLTILAIALALLGLIGCIVPALPGPPLSFVALLLMQATRFADYSWAFFVIWLCVTILVTVADYYLPAMMTRRFGGSRYATWGSTIGIVAGFFIFPPWGIILWPFVGALVGELLWNRGDSVGALRVAFGSFVAFLFGTGAKMIASGMMLFYVVKPLFA